MRDYGRVYTAFWTSEDIRSLTDDGRLLALYLLTSPHSTIAGVFRLPDGYASDDLQWGTERVSEGFHELLGKGFVDRCETTKWVWIRRFLDWNAPDGPNQWKAARKVAALIPAECRWKAQFSQVFARAAGDPPPLDPQLPANRSEPHADDGARAHHEPIGNPSGTVPKPIRIQEQEQETEPHVHLRAPGGGDDGADPLKREDAQGELLSARSGPGAQPHPGRRIGDAVDRVFAHWQRLYGHPRAVLDSKRRKIITNALAAYSEADLCRAIEGYRSSPHHMGQNDRATVYDDIELFLRDARHIESGLKFATAPPHAGLSTLTRKNVAAVADWVPPEMRHASK